MEIVFNIFLSAILISTALWISKSNPILGGFIVSLPLSTLIVLALSRIQGSNSEVSSTLAKSIFVGIPASTVFFVPFLLAEKLKLGFWTCYVSGFCLLGLGYFVHRYLVSHLIK